jgi:hypothetical protein
MVRIFNIFDGSPVKVNHLFGSRKGSSVLFYGAVYEMAILL